MAADSNKFPAGFIIFVLFSLLSVVFPSASSQHASCVDGTYEHDGRYCCLCGAGLYLVKHCVKSPHDGQCEPCDPGSYRSHPSDQTSCERCTSCSHPNENLEEDQPCTSARDTVCRCQKDHYCISATETCKLCHPCKKCGAEGIKVDCAANNNTICNDEGRNPAGIIVGIIVPIAVIALVVGGAFLWRKKKLERRHSPADSQMNGHATDEERSALRDVDLQSHLPDLAEAIGWTTMQDVAFRTGTPGTVIDAVKLNHPSNTQEQTLQLLRDWVERQGREAPNNLIQNLKNGGKKDTADKVSNICRLAARSNCPA